VKEKKADQRLQQTPAAISCCHAMTVREAAGAAELGRYQA